MTELKTIRIKSNLLKNLKCLADLDNRNLNNLIETILIEYVTENQTKLVGGTV